MSMIKQVVSKRHVIALAGKDSPSLSTRLNPPRSRGSFSILPGITSTTPDGDADPMYVSFINHVASNIASTFGDHPANNCDITKWYTVPDKFWSDEGHPPFQDKEKATVLSQSSTFVKTLEKMIPLALANFSSDNIEDYKHQSFGTSSYPYWHNDFVKKSEYIESQVLDPNNEAVRMIIAKGRKMPITEWVNIKAISMVQRRYSNGSKVRVLIDANGEKFESDISEFPGLFEWNENFGPWRSRPVTAVASIANWPGAYICSSILSRYLKTYKSTYKATTPERLQEKFEYHPFMVGVDIANFDWNLSPTSFDIIIKGFADHISNEFAVFARNTFDIPVISRATSEKENKHLIVYTDPTETDYNKGMWYGLPSGHFLTVIIGRLCGTAAQLSYIERALDIEMTTTTIDSILKGEHSRVTLSNSTDDTIFGFRSKDDEASLRSLIDLASNSDTLIDDLAYKLELEYPIQFLGMTCYRSEGKVKAYSSLDGFFARVLVRERPFTGNKRSSNLKKYPFLGWWTRYETYSKTLPPGWAAKGLALMAEAAYEIYGIEDFSLNMESESTKEKAKLGELMTPLVALYLTSPNQYYANSDVKEAIDNLTDEESMLLFDKRPITVPADKIRLMSKGLFNF